MRKCYYKPNRTKKRYFKPCDVARIARNCVDDNEGVTNIITLACVARGLGFKRLCLSEKQIAEAKEYKKKVDLEAKKAEDLQKAKDSAEKAIEIGKTVAGSGFVRDLPEKVITKEEAEAVTNSVLRRMLAGRRALLVAVLAAVALALEELFKGGKGEPVDTDTKDDKHRCVDISEVLPESMCNCKGG